MGSGYVGSNGFVAWFYQFILQGSFLATGSDLLLYTLQLISSYGLTENRQPMRLTLMSPLQLATAHSKTGPRTSKHTANVLHHFAGIDTTRNVLSTVVPKPFQTRHSFTAIYFHKLIHPN